MSHEKYVYLDVWFAWRPVRTTNLGWVWLRYVERKTDDRPEVYLGLMPSVSYTAFDGKQ
jgi:hypothetical protein